MIAGVVITAIAMTSKSGSTCTANVAGIDTTVSVSRDQAVAAGDRIIITKMVTGEWFCVGRAGTTAPPPPEEGEEPALPPPTKPTVTYGKTTFNPKETRSRQGSKWRTDNDDVYQGEYGNGNHVGVAFYGNGPSSLNGATCTGVSVRVKRKSRGGAYSAQDTTIRLVDQKTRPSGAVTLGATADGPNLRVGEKATFTLPDAWGQELINGTAGGIAIYESDGSPYVILEGRSSYSASFALTLSWERTN